MKNSFFSRLTPKEPKFFPLLKKMPDVIIETSELMIECVQSKDHQTSIDYYKKSRQKSMREMCLLTKFLKNCTQLCITPFDREDINNLSNKLDDVTDGINSSAKRIALYNPKQIPADALKIAELINESAICIGKAIDELDVLKKVQKKLKYIAESCMILNIKPMMYMKISS